MSDSGRVTGQTFDGQYTYVSGLPVVDILNEIRKIHSQRADDRCWRDLDRLFELCSLPPADKRVGDKFAMIKNCVRFVEEQCEQGGPWKSYAELESELQAAKREVEAFQRVAVDAVELQQQLNSVRNERDSYKNSYNFVAQESVRRRKALEEREKQLTDLKNELKKAHDERGNAVACAEGWERRVECLERAVKRYRNALQSIVTQSSDYSDRLTAQKALEGEKP